jgi:hypothetical protein
MDAVSLPVAGAVASGLIAAILAMWKYVIIGNKKCEERNAKLESRVDDLQTKFIDRSDVDLVKAEERAEKAWHRERELGIIIKDSSTAILRAATVIDNVSAVTKDAARLVRIAHEGGMLRKTPLPMMDESTPLVNRVIAGHQ